MTQESQMHKFYDLLSKMGIRVFEDCGLCHSRGFTAYNKSSDRIVACKCIKKRVDKILSDAKETESEVVEDKIVDKD